MSPPFLVADVIYAAKYRWLPPAWAAAQIVVGGGVNAYVASVGMTSQARMCEYGTFIPTTAAVLSIGFIAHGVASLILYRAPSATQTSPGAVGPSFDGVYVRWVPDIVVTRERDTSLVFRGTF